MNNTLLLERCHKFIDQNGSFVDESENLLKDLEAAMAEQAKPQDPAFYLYPQHLAQLKLCDTLLCELSTVKMEGATACYTRPQAREPMSEDELDELVVNNKNFKALARAIEAHHGIK